MYRLITALFVLVAITVSASAQSLPVPSYWLNQRSSEMKLYNIDAQGRFLGVFINHAAGFSCQNTPYDLEGRVWRDHVGFAVVWKNWVTDCKSMTVWHGRVSGHTIWTRWVLYVRKGNNAIPVLHGRDAFQLQP
jgi:hypothetical protein